MTHNVEILVLWVVLVLLGAGFYGAMVLAERKARRDTDRIKASIGRRLNQATSAERRRCRQIVLMAPGNVDTRQYTDIDGALKCMAFDILAAIVGGDDPGSEAEDETC